VARVIAVRRRPMRIAGALIAYVVPAAVSWQTVVTTAVQIVGSAETPLALGRVVNRRVVFVTFAVNEILADCGRVVTTANQPTT